LQTKHVYSKHSADVTYTPKDRPEGGKGNKFKILCVFRC